MEIEGLNELVADLRVAPLRAQLGATRAVRDVSTKVRDDARRLAGGIAHAPLYPAAITADVKLQGHTIEAEIGPDKDRPQGALGNILEYGTSKNAPLSHLGPALDLNGPAFEKAMSEDVGL